MRQTWRWFGPVDKVTLADARQAGVEAIVTALHHVATGAVWTPEQIEKRQREVAFHPDGTMTHLRWEAVESLPVSEAIKTQTGEWRAHIVHYRRSLENLARAGIQVVCYNFMPVLDWTRTDLGWRVAHGGKAMRFDIADFAAFDIHILKRKGAAGDFPEPVVAEAAKRFALLDDAQQKKLAANITAGLPGSQEHWSLDTLSAQLATYHHRIGAETLRRHCIDFLSEVAPHAEMLGVRLCCHPDDPPFALLGLPRIMSTLADYKAVLDAVNVPANGVTFCTGSFGARPDNDLPAMVNELAPRIHFVHLRNVRRDREAVPCSFFEDDHLAGQADMVAVIAALLAEERRRRESGRADAEIPMRPDHGQDILDDLKRGAQPGYPAIGRLKGLAELRGVMAALSHPQFGR